MAKVEKNKIGNLRKFVGECYDLLNNLDKELILLGKNTESKELLDSIYSNFRYFLEESRFYGFSKLESFVNVGEQLVSHFRTSAYEINNETITIILKLNLGIRDIVFSIDDTGREPQTVNSSIISDLEEVIKKQEVIAEEEFRVDARGLNMSLDENDFTHHLQGQGQEISPLSNVQITPMAPPGGGVQGYSNANIVFSDTEFLEKLMNIIIELIHTNTIISDLAKVLKKSNLSKHSSRLDVITRDLYSLTIRAKTKPLSSLMKNLDSLVVEMAQNLDKQVQFSVEGGENELDDNQLDILRVCFIQLIKNSIEHGIEVAEDRVIANKQAYGEIKLKAYQRGELFYIAVVDDGRGIDPNKVRKKLIDKDLLLTEEAERLSDEEVVNYLFQGSLSSSKIASAQGLDIVRANVKQISGKIFLNRNYPGQGVDIQITVPRMNVIIPAVIITLASERYIIAKINLFEITQVASETLINSLEVIKSIPFFKYRGDMIPLVYLNRLVRFEEGSHEEEEARKVSVLILELDEKRFGLVADSVLDMEEVVVRPLPEEIKGIYLFSGTALLKDETPALILDIGEIMRTHFKEVLYQEHTHHEHHEQEAGE